VIPHVFCEITAKERANAAVMKNLKRQKVSLNENTNSLFKKYFFAKAYPSTQMAVKTENSRFV
jgi:DNA-binding transcriptional regulator YbjK